MKRKNYQRGTDSVNAKLTPREAVLNVNAAELLGRHNIAALNAHGNMLAERGVNLASDPTPGPSTENLLGYQTGTADVRRDDRDDLLRDADATFYGGGHVPAPSPTPKPVRGYAYGTDDVRRNMRTTDRYYRGININAGPSSNAITSTPQSQQILNTNPGRYDLTSGRILSPEQNPAYQAAIAKGRPNTGAYTWITTPSGGQMKVPSGSVNALLKKGSTLEGSRIGDQSLAGFQRPNQSASYALGDTGAVPTGNTPYEKSYRLGFNAENPVQQPDQSFGYQVGNALANTAPTALSFIGNAASRVASAVGNLFGGGNNNTAGPSFPPSTGASAPSPTPIQTPPPAVTPTPTPPPQQPFNTENDQNLVGYQRGTANVMPRRYSDYY